MPVQPLDRVGHRLKATRNPTGERLADFFECQVRLLGKEGIQFRQGFVREGGLPASPPRSWGNRSFLFSSVKQFVNPADRDLELIGNRRDRLFPAITCRHDPFP
jgi:hypothetical protein